MQDCFRKYPEIYGAELQDDEQDGENTGPDNQQPGVEGVPEGVAASESQSQSKPADVTAAAPSEKTTTAETKPTAKSDATIENSAPAPAAASEAPKDDIVQAEASHFDATEQKPVEAVDDSHVPTAAFDATGANKN